MVPIISDEILRETFPPLSVSASAASVYRMARLPFDRQPTPASFQLALLLPLHGIGT